jgi:hypothetical protein
MGFASRHLWESLPLLAESPGAIGRALRFVNDSVALAVLLRQRIASEPFSSRTSGVASGSDPAATV